MNVTRFKLLVLLGGCCLGCAVRVVAAQNSITVTAFQTSGQLTFSAPMGTRCAIEWASHPTSEWSRTWDQLAAFAVIAPTTTAKVPMFYRVVCWSNTPFLGLPFEGLSDMGPINEAYSETASCPWGFIHNGIDFFPTVNLKAFVAAASGTVTGVQLFHVGENWAVDVGILHDDYYSSGYTFEPMSSSVLHGSNQLENVIVTAHQAVAQGEIIGYLYTPSNGAHVHYQFMTNWEATCPEPYFDNAAVTSILYLLDLQWPGAAMCY